MCVCVVDYKMTGFKQGSPLTALPAVCKKEKSAPPFLIFLEGCVLHLNYI